MSGPGRPRERAPGETGESESVVHDRVHDPVVLEED